MAIETKTDGVGKRIAAVLRTMTSKQRDWVCRFVDTKNALATTKTVYRCKSDKSARVMSFKLKAHPKVKAVLAIMDGMSEREIYLKQLAKDRDACEPGSVAHQRFHALYARVAFGVSTGKRPGTPDPEFDDDSEDDGVEMVPLGKLIERPDGKRYRVTLVEVSK